VIAAVILEILSSVSSLHNLLEGVSGCGSKRHDMHEVGREVCCNACQSNSTLARGSHAMGRSVCSARQSVHYTGI
jgi:hypothetical protein